MANRKPIPKKIRFEVFKRDKFTCQYCGRTVPDVILQVDHIKPVAKGGTNDIINLVTSCRDCNLGKGARELSDDTILQKQQEQLQDIAEKKEQLEMMIAWRESLKEFEKLQIEAITNVIKPYAGKRLPRNTTSKIRNLLKQFTVEELIEAAEIAFRRYYYGDDESYDLALRKMGGICYNKRNRPFDEGNPETYRWWNDISIAYSEVRNDSPPSWLWNVFLDRVKDEAGYHRMMDAIHSLEEHTQDAEQDLKGID